MVGGVDAVRAGLRGRSRLGNADWDPGGLRGDGVDHLQCARAMAVWLKHRHFADGDSRGCRLLDLVVGTRWPAPGNASHGLFGSDRRDVLHLEFLNVLLGDEPVLTPEARFYQRLLAMNYDEAVDIAEEFATEKSLAELYEEVFIPALSLAESDRHHGVLDPERERFIFDTTRELIQELPERLEAAKNTQEPRTPKQLIPGNPTVLCLPAADEADELAAEMLAQLLTERGVAAKAIAAKALASERLEEVHKAGVPIVCVSAIPPGAVAPIRYVCKRLRAEVPELKITVGIWQKEADLPRLQQRIGANLADAIVTRLAQAVEQISPAASSQDAARPSKRRGRSAWIESHAGTRARLNDLAKVGQYPIADPTFKLNSALGVEVPGTRRR